MADRLYLSFWLRGYSAMNMLRHYEKALSLFPFSKLTKNPATFRIYAVEYSEPSLYEDAIPQPVNVEGIIDRAKGYFSADSCYELEAAWDLWRWMPDEGAANDEGAGDWKLAPARVTIAAYGPDFQHDSDEHVRFDFGMETAFLPDEERLEGMAMIRSNIQSLLRLVHDLDDKLTVERRLLWSESGENFADKLQASLQALE